jgi:hypothetical protein
MSTAIVGGSYEAKDTLRVDMTEDGKSLHFERIPGEPENGAEPTRRPPPQATAK